MSNRIAKSVRNRIVTSINYCYNKIMLKKKESQLLVDRHATREEASRDDPNDGLLVHKHICSRLFMREAPCHWLRNSPGHVSEKSAPRGIS